jgi:hypothetical protein
MYLLCKPNNNNNNKKKPGYYSMKKVASYPYLTFQSNYAFEIF